MSQITSDSGSKFWKLVLKRKSWIFTLWSVCVYPNHENVLISNWRDKQNLLFKFRRRYSLKSLWLWSKVWSKLTKKWRLIRYSTQCCLGIRMCRKILRSTLLKFRVVNKKKIKSSFKFPAPLNQLYLLH